MTTALTLHNVGYSVIAPFFPDKFKEKGVPEHSVGVVFSIYSAMWLIISPLTGKLMNRFSRRGIIQVLLIPIKRFNEGIPHGSRLPHFSFSLDASCTAFRSLRFHLQTLSATFMRSIGLFSACEYFKDLQRASSRW